MQDRVSSSAYSVAPSSGSQSAESGFITLYDIKRFIVLYFKTIAVSVVIGILLAFAYVMVATPLYTARTQIVIDPSVQQAIREPNSGIFSLDKAQLESQLEVLRSEKIAKLVIERLNLEDNPEFTGIRPSFLSRVLHLFRPQPPVTLDAFSKERLTLGRLQGGLMVRRVGFSYAIEIEFRSRSPELAAKIANATAEAYVAEQLSARAEAVRQGALWLEDRIAKLRKQMNAAALAAQEFRAKRDYRLVPSNDTTAEGQRDRKSNRERAETRRNTIEALDSTAQTYRRIYESYLKAYTESVQKQSYPITNARVITPATRPLGKSHPRTKLILAFGGMLGGLAGLGIAFLRHSLDRGVWDPRQIREEIGVECLASIPLLPGRQAYPAIARAMLGKAPMGQMVRAMVDNPPPAVRPDVTTVKGALRLAAPKSGGRDAAAVGAATDADDTLNAVMTMPFCSFSHGIKTLKTAISLAGRIRQIRCMAITSALPNEGKTTIAANLATLFALSGVRTLLVDGDLRNASLTYSLAPGVEFGILEAIEGSVDAERCIVHGVNESGLDLLPASDISRTAHSDEILGSEMAYNFIQNLQQAYDIVIFELPPLTATLDGLTMSSILDCTMLVSEWSKTPLPVISEAIRLLRSARADILGVALNKVDTSTLHYGDAAANYSYNYRSDTSNAPTPLRRRA